MTWQPRNTVEKTVAAVVFEQLVSFEFLHVVLICDFCVMFTSQNSFHLLRTGDGRISMAGLNPSNVEYLCLTYDQLTWSWLFRKVHSLLASFNM